jgi:putative intracellular protease/amidase
VHKIKTLIKLVGLFLSVLILEACSEGSQPPSPVDGATVTHGPLRVMIFDDGGAPDRSAEFVEHCLKIVKPEEYSIRRINGDDVRGGALAIADVAVFPGGSGSGQAKSLQAEGRQKVREFVKNGGGYLGICGGSYLATSDYSWSLNMVNAVVVDRKHWARGRATLRLDFTPLGKQLLGVPTDSVDCLYHQGPLLSPDAKKDLPAYEPLATFGTEVADNGAPRGVMIGTDAMVRTIFGKGHVILISPHPEQTNGLDYIVRAAVKWISHPEIVANPLTGDTTNANGSLSSPISPATQSASAR